MRVNSLYVYLAGVLLAAVCLLGSCQKGDTVYEHYSSIYNNLSPKTYKIAVVLPISSNGEYRSRLENTVKWALENMRDAQKLLAEEGDSSLVDLDIEWHDEDTENIDSLAGILAKRDDLLLIVGPERNGNVDIMASACSKTNKTLIVPCATSEEIVRRYAAGSIGSEVRTPFLWSLCETDVSLCEALLAKAREGGAENLKLLSPDDEYGKTFSDWIPFQAAEMNMSLKDNVHYNSTDDLAESARQVLQGNVDCAVCAVHNAAEAKVILEERQKMGDKAPRILFTGGVLSEELLEMDELAEGSEGITPYADPSTGFAVAYKQHFNKLPLSSEAQIYDALLLAGFTAFVSNYYHGEKNTNKILELITSKGEDSYNVWNEAGIRSLINILQSGNYVKLVGASGALRFDSETFTTLIESTYAQWMIYGGELIVVDYYSSNGSKRVTPTMASWNWQAKQQQELADKDVDIVYQPHKDSWAVLVRASEGWRNYRHEADVLNMYQMLKRKGWDDDHIILILANDIVDDPENKHPGVVSSSVNGSNLYQGVQIDYKTDTLAASDIQKILLGESSAHLPVVLNTDCHSNILFFWSGHGCLKSYGRAENGFLWREAQTPFYESELKQTLNRMSENKCYRKMLMLFEPCYSENMIKQVEGIPGMLAFASASSDEQSFADCRSFEMSVWLSDRFSNNIVKQLDENSNKTYREFYSYLVSHTLGSHVKVAGAAHFDNLFTATPEEFVVPKSCAAF
jgi:glycosylphosphatidylinositol transamidase (GPIT) subunit GPI8